MSIIDHILVEKPNRRLAEDVRVYRGAQIHSDHYLLAARLKHPRRPKKNEQEPQSRRKESKEVTKSYK